MKSTFYTLLLLCAAFSTFSQGSQSDNQWSFGLEIFPNSTYEIITNENGATTENENFYRNTEKPKFCLSGMGYVSYNLGRRSVLSLGIGYQNTGYRTTKLPINYGSEIDPRIGFVTPSSDPDPSLPSDIEITYNHHSIQFPLFYKFDVTSKFFIRGGISYIVSVSNNSNADLYFQSGEKKRENYSFDNSDYRKMNASGNLGAGYTYFKSDHSTLYAQINVERFFYSMSSNGFTQRTPVSTGLILGCRF